MAGLRVVVLETLSAVPGFGSHAKGALRDWGNERGSCTFAGEVGDTVQAMACDKWQVGVGVADGKRFDSEVPISCFVVRMKLEAASNSSF